MGEHGVELVALGVRLLMDRRGVLHLSLPDLLRPRFLWTLSTQEWTLPRRQHREHGRWLSHLVLDFLQLEQALATRVRVFFWYEGDMGML